MSTNNVVQAFKNAGKIVYKFNQIIAWPVACICFWLKISANIVTCTRLLSPIVFYWLFASSSPLWLYLAALFLFAYTDAVDGLLASERFEAKSPSDIGTILDPVSDKLFMMSVYIFHYHNFPKLIAITIIGEIMIMLLVLGYLACFQTVSTMRANMWGKTKMNLEIVTVALMTWYYITRSAIIETAAIITGSTAIFFLVGSLYSKVRKILP